MGANFAHDLAGIMDLERGLAIHLTSNHYPPVPVYMVQPCVDAIDAANAEDYDTLIELPEGVSYRGASAVPAHVIINEFHLGAWVDVDQDY